MTAKSGAVRPSPPRMRSRLSFAVDLMAFVVPVLEMAAMAAVMALLVAPAASPGLSSSSQSARPGEVWTLHR